MMTLSISGLKPEIQVLRHCIPHHRPDNDTTKVLSGAVTRKPHSSWANTAPLVLSSK
jgi:hypothetical protein